MEKDMVRDKIKDVQYFNVFINEDMQRIEKFKNKLNNNEVKKDRILPVKTAIHDLKLGILIARYSKGDELNVLKDEFEEIFEEWVEVWRPEFYSKNLQMLSLGVLFNIDSKKVKSIKNLLMKSNINDWLYNILLEFLGESIHKENVELLFPQVYGLLKKIINSKDNQAYMMKEYISNWYANHKDCGWYDSHKSTQNIYYGYWSFEAGAITKILKIDDELFKNQQYYPYDLVHFENEV